VNAIAAVADVRVMGTTATQAVLAYSAPSEAACTIQISEANNFDAAYAPVHDVDPTLFPGSQRDDRPGSLAHGRERVFIAGQRTSERAADQKLYSRALQANTTHYFRVTCGGETAERGFQTANIPLGTLFPEPPPIDPGNPGEYGWPNFSTALRSSYPGNVSTEKMVDPDTGLLTRRWTLQSDVTTYETVSNFSVAAGGNDWNTPEKAMADDGNTDANAAVYNGTGRSSLFLGYTSFDTGVRAFLNWGIAQGGTDYYRLTLKGWASGATPEDRTVEVCLTFDTKTCGSVSKEVVLATAPGTYSISDTNGTWMSDWNLPGHPVITRSQIGSPNGMVNVSGTLVTRTDSPSNYGWFSPRWRAGSKITINGVERTIVRVLAANRLEISEDLGSLTNAPYTASNFGILIQKKTTGPGQVSIGFVQARTRSSMGAYYWSASAVSEDCSRLQAADGRYYCNVSGKLYSIDPRNGDSRLLGSARVPATTPGVKWGVPYNGGSWNGDCGATTYVDLTWSTTDPLEWYCLIPVGTPDEVHLVKGRYTGDGSGLPSQFLTTDTWATPALVTYTDLSAELDISSMIRAFSQTHNSPEVFDPALHSCNLAGGHYSTYLPFWCLRGGGQDKLGWLAVYDTTTNAVIAAMSTHANTWPARWGAGHGASMFNTTPWMSGAGQGTGRLDGGTATGAGYYANKIPAGIPACTIGSTCEVCPANLSGNPNLPRWPAGQRKCTTIVVDGEPCDLDPNPTTETNTNHPHCGTASGHFLQDAKSGDIFIMASKYGEFMRLLSKTGDGKNQTWVMERKYGSGWRGIGSCGQNCSLIATAGSAMVDETNAADNYAGSLYWNFLSDPAGLNEDGNTVIVDGNGINAHNATNNGYRVVVLETGRSSSYRIGKGSELGAMLNPPFEWITGNPGFGKPENTFPSATESHVGMNHVAAPDYEKHWTVDARPWLGNSVYGTGATPVGGMSNTYRVGQSMPLSRKHLPTLAFCGYHPLADLSGPASSITDLTPYTYCVANAAGECVPGSASGDAYVSCPMVVSRACGTDNQPEKEDICVGDLRPFTGAQVQLGLRGSDPSGFAQRLLTRSYTRFKLQGPYWNIKALPDASWFYTRNDWLEGSSNHLLLFKNPGWPAEDNVNRTTFVPVQVQLGSSPTNADNVVVEFGYNRSFECTSRHEACVAVTSAINDRNPFYWAGESYSGLGCRGGCTVVIPAVPQRVVYYRVKYRDAGNAVVQTGQTEVAVSP
jgi:hypothetical protein